MPLLFGSVVGGGFGFLCSPIILLKRHHRYIFAILAVCFALSLPVAAMSGLSGDSWLAIGLTGSSALASLYLLARGVFTSGRDLLAAANTLLAHGAEPFLIAIKHDNPNVRARAAQFLGAFGGDEVQKALIGASSDPSRHVRMWSAFSLGEIGGPVVLPTLHALSRDPEEIVRRRAAEAVQKVTEAERRR